MKKIHFLTSGLLLLFLLLWIWSQSSESSQRDVTSGASVSLPVIHDAKKLATRPVAPTSRESFWQPLLQKSWRFYKQQFMPDGTHVVSNNYGGTITEGQSYALLKALWMDEPETFTRIWQWTQTHMRRSTDHLLGWRWGKHAQTGVEGLLEIENATDADQDIAYALLLAGERWRKPVFTQDGLAMARDIWRLNVKQQEGRYYLLPGTWEAFQSERLVLDPSYFAPYVYQTFARYDRLHAAGWRQLATDIYDTLDACSRLTTNQLPPNWCAVEFPTSHRQKPVQSAARNQSTYSSERLEKKSAPNAPSTLSKPRPFALPRIVFSDLQGPGSRDFGYDAFRVYWRMLMDAKLSPSPGRERALAYLKSHDFLLKYWQQHQRVPEGFSSTGQPLSQTTSGFSLGPVLVLNQVTPLPFFRQPDGSANDVAFYHASLRPYYHADGYWFNDYNDFLHSVIWLHLYAVSLDMPK